MNQLRITMLAPFGMRPKGTLAARMLPLAQALARRGNHIHILAPPVHNPQDAGTYRTYPAQPTAPAAAPPTAPAAPPPVIVQHTAHPTLPGIAGVVQQTLTLLGPALAQQADILHLFKPKGYSGLAALLARALRPTLPLVVDTDDWEGWGGWNDLLPYPALARQFFAWQERDLPHRAQAVTVASRTLETQVWSFGVPPARVFYLPNGIDLPTRTGDRQARRPHIAGHPATVLLYTRFWELNLSDLVATLVVLVQRRPTIRLLVVGQGERQQERDLLHLAQRAGVANALDYRGWTEPDQLPTLLAEADCAIVPLDDTLINRARCSAKLLELLAAGIPVVAANVGQTSAYIQDGQSGLLVPPGDPAALAQAVLRLLANPALQQRLRAGASTSLAAFTWDALAPLAERAYTHARSAVAAP